MSVITSQLPPQHHQPRGMMGGGPRYPPPSHFSQPGDHHGSSGFRPRLGYQPYRPFPRVPHPHAHPPSSSSSTTGGDATVEYDGRRLRKSLVRKTVDYNAAIVKYLQVKKKDEDIYLFNDDNMIFIFARIEFGNEIPGIGVPWNQIILMLQTPFHPQCIQIIVQML